MFESRAVEIIHKTDGTIGQLSDNETIPPSAHLSLNTLVKYDKVEREWDTNKRVFSSKHI